ncbi:hypothetical protein C8R46DRAFT_1037648 [Mycena filopes]|nr:hypothetical protein C8R46DRAFT_1037648 [Mycena filopes]
MDDECECDERRMKIKGGRKGQAGECMSITVSEVEDGGSEGEMIARVRWGGWGRIRMESERKKRRKRHRPLPTIPTASPRVSAPTAPTRTPPPRMGIHMRRARRANHAREALARGLEQCGTLRAQRYHAARDSASNSYLEKQVVKGAGCPRQEEKGEEVKRAIAEAQVISKKKRRRDMEASARRTPHPGVAARLCRRPKWPSPKKEIGVDVEQKKARKDEKRDKAGSARRACEEGEDGACQSKGGGQEEGRRGLRSRDSGVLRISLLGLELDETLGDAVDISIRIRLRSWFTPVQNTIRLTPAAGWVDIRSPVGYSRLDANVHEAEEGRRCEMVDGGGERTRLMGSHRHDTAVGFRRDLAFDHHNDLAVRLCAAAGVVPNMACLLV